MSSYVLGQLNCSHVDNSLYTSTAISTNTCCPAGIDFDQLFIKNEGVCGTITRNLIWVESIIFMMAPMVLLYWSIKNLVNYKEKGMILLNSLLTLTILLFFIDSALFPALGRYHTASRIIFALFTIILHTISYIWLIYYFLPIYGNMKPWLLGFFGVTELFLVILFIFAPINNGGYFNSNAIFYLLFSLSLFNFFIYSLMGVSFNSILWMEKENETNKTSAKNKKTKSNNRMPIFEVSNISPDQMQTYCTYFEHVVVFNFYYVMFIDVIGLALTADGNYFGSEIAYKFNCLQKIGLLLFLREIR